MSSITIATKVDEDSKLVKQFNEYKEENSMNSKSEATRALMRAGLEQEHRDDDDDTADEAGRSADDSERASVLSTEKLTYVAVAFFAGFQTLPSWFATIDVVSLATAVTGALILIAVPITVSRELIREVSANSDQFDGILSQRTQEAD